MDFILSIVIGIVSGLIGSVVIFIIVCIGSRKNEIFISDRIAVGTNFSRYEKDGETAWKFQIINKSRFVTFFGFDIKLTSILYVENNDGTFTQHRNDIPCVCNWLRLSNYESKSIVLKERKKNKKYTIGFTYRPYTYENIEKGFEDGKYDELELSVVCTDSLTGNRRFFTRVFNSTAFAEGEFSNDGDDKIKPCKVSKEAWENHNKRVVIAQ